MLGLSGLSSWRSSIRGDTVVGAQALLSSIQCNWPLNLLSHFWGALHCPFPLHPKSPPTRPPLRSGQSRLTIPNTYFTITMPASLRSDCCSPSLRNRCSPSPEYPTSLGTRISTNNLLNRHMLPALNRCRHCGLNDGKKHLEQNHRYEGDERLPRWHGWHAARRGLGTNLYRLGVPDKVIQAILRHSNVNVTLGYYIKPQTPDVVAAMGRFEAEIAAHDFGDTNRTLNRTSSAVPESVN